MQEKNYNEMLKNFNKIELTDKEKKYLKWLSGWDKETHEVFIGIFKKLSQD